MPASLFSFHFCAAVQSLLFQKERVYVCPDRCWFKSTANFRLCFQKNDFFFSCPRLQVANWQQMGRIGPADVVVQPERSVIEAKLSCYIERSSLSGPCLHHSLCLGSIVTPLSGPLGIRVCNLRFRLRKCAFQAKNPPCYDSLVIFHHGTHSYVLLALLQ